MDSTNGKTQNSCFSHLSSAVTKWRRPVFEQKVSEHSMLAVETEKLYSMFLSSDDSGLNNATRLTKALSALGIRRSDPRLQQLWTSIRNLQSEPAKDLDFSSSGEPYLEDYAFKAVILENIDVMNKFLMRDLVIPDFSSFCQHIEKLYETCKKDTSGKQASYIPQLERVDPDLWGVAVCTIDGQRFSVGDVTETFTVQSTSKPINYAIACGENGSEHVHRFVGQEPSGRCFNEICLDNNRKPHNPMINSGAIMVSALIKPDLDISDRFHFMFETYQKMTGGEHLGFNNAVYLSEREAADRNFALAYLMRENKCFAGKPELTRVLDFYFQLCSLEVNCESAAVIAGTLANGGVCPITGEKILKSEAVRDTLCLMNSCGMYDYSGQFAFRCGIPAKSGVSGIIIVVIPNVVGFALYSPRLDACGNSARGVSFCKALVDRFNFHHFDNMSAGDKIDPRGSKNNEVLSKILYAAAVGDISTIGRCSATNVDLDSGDYDGRTALHLAASEGHLRTVKYLIEDCAVSVNPKDRWGREPIEEAKDSGHTAVAAFLRKVYRRKDMPLPAAEGGRGEVVAVAPHTEAFGSPPASAASAEVDTTSEAEKKG